jgi:hypothetical protein
MTLSGAIRNTGTQPTTGSFWVELHVWPDPEFQPVGPYLCDSYNIRSTLAPGEAIDLESLSPRVSNILPPGSYHVGVCIDALKEIAEQREDDNLAWLIHRRLHVGQRPAGTRTWNLYR